MSNIKLQKIINDPKKLSIVVALFVFAFYLLTFSSTIVFGDAGDLVTSSFVLGVPHPPGYPLHTLLGSLFIHLIPIGNIAQRVTLVSTVFAALAVFILFHLVYKLTKSTLAAGVSALFLGFASNFWTYAVVADVFALNNFFAMALIFTVITWREKIEQAKDTERLKVNFKWLALLAFTYGLAFTNHHTIVLLGPALLIFVLWVYWEQGLLGRLGSLEFLGRHLLLLLLFALPFALYLYLPWAASRSPITNWDNPTTLPRFIRLFTRADYGSISLAAGTASTKPSTESPFLQIPLLLKSQFWQFTGVGFLLGILGIWVSYRKDKKVFTLLGLGYLFSGIIFFMYTNMSVENSPALSALERFMLLPNLMLAVWIGYGATRLLEDRGWRAEVGERRLEIKRLISRLSNLKPRISFQPSTLDPQPSNIQLSNYYPTIQPSTFLLLASCFLSLVMHYNGVNQRGNYLFYHYGLDTLESARQNASYPTEAGKKGILLFTKGDLANFILKYIQHVEGRYQDIITINFEMISYDWYVEDLRQRYPNLKLNFKSLDGLSPAQSYLPVVQDNLADYVINIPQMDFAGMFGKYTLIPLGMNYLVTEVDKRDLNMPEYQEISQKFWGSSQLARYIKKQQEQGKDIFYQEKYPWTWWRDEVSSNYSALRSNTGEIYLNFGRPDEALLEFKTALSTNPKLIEWIAHFGMGKAYFDKGLFAVAREEFEKSLSLNPKNPAVYKNLGIIYAQHIPNKDRAILMFETYLQLASDDGQAGEIRKVLGELKKG